MATAAIAALLVCVSPQVRDGDDLVCAGGLVAPGAAGAAEQDVRLAVINARERWGGCRGRAPCPLRSARAAVANLQRLVAGQRVTCRPLARSYHRIVARCFVGGVDLSCAQLRAGVAAEWPRYVRQHGPACEASQPGLSRR